MSSIIKYSFLHTNVQKTLAFEGLALPVEAVINGIATQEGMAGFGVGLSLSDARTGAHFPPMSSIQKNADILVKVRPPPAEKLYAEVQGVGNVRVSRGAQEFRRDRQQAPQAAVEAQPEGPVDSLYGLGISAGRRRPAAEGTGASKFGYTVNRDAGGFSGAMQTHARFSVPEAPLKQASTTLAAPKRADVFAEFVSRMVPSGQRAAVPAPVEEVDATIETTSEAVETLSSPPGGAAAKKVPKYLHELDDDPFEIVIKPQVESLDPRYRFDLVTESLPASSLSSLPPPSDAWTRTAPAPVAAVQQHVAAPGAWVMPAAHVDNNRFNAFTPGPPRFAMPPPGHPPFMPPSMRGPPPFQPPFNPGLHQHPGNAPPPLLSTPLLSSEQSSYRERQDRDERRRSASPLVQEGERGYAHPRYAGDRRGERRGGERRGEERGGRGRGGRRMDERPAPRAANRRDANDGDGPRRGSRRPEAREEGKGEERRGEERSERIDSRKDVPQEGVQPSSASNTRDIGDGDTRGTIHVRGKRRGGEGRGEERGGEDRWKMGSDSK